MINKTKLQRVSRFTEILLLVVPYFQFVLWISTIEYCLFRGYSFFTIDYIVILFNVSVALWFLLRIYFLIARKWQRRMMIGFISFFVIQTCIGVIYKYYTPLMAHFTEEDLTNIENYICKDKSLTSNLHVVCDNDSVQIIMKDVKDRIIAYRLRLRCTLTTEFYESNINIYWRPDDLKDYMSLVKVENESLFKFWELQYPRGIIYIHIKGCNCGRYSYKPCYYYYDEFFYGRYGRIEPFLIGLFEGKLDDRYKKYYKYFQKIIHPKYVRTDLVKDPYFLIYQGRYNEAREGLKDLPPARRSFCEKKLKALGY